MARTSPSRKVVEKATLKKVVAHLRNHTLVKGYVDALPAAGLEGLLQGEPAALPQEIPVRSAESGKLVTVSVDSLKALFFVKSFEGHKEHKEIRFFEQHPPLEGLLVHVRFFDNESTEGLICNSLHHLVSLGFFLKPPDPQSNNEMVYVVKSSLSEFHVLRVTSIN